MAVVDRRSFVRSVAVVGGAGLVGGLALLKPLSRNILAQQATAQSVFLTGRIVAVAGDVIYAADSKGPLTLYVSDKTSVWKGKDVSDLGVLRPGDFFYATAEASLGGRLTVKKLYANIVNYYGLLTAANGNQLQILVYRVGPTDLFVRAKIDAETIVYRRGGTGSSSDVIQGRFVQMVGLELPDGVVKATRLWVYE